RDRRQIVRGRSGRIAEWRALEERVHEAIEQPRWPYILHRGRRGDLGRRGETPGPSLARGIALSREQQLRMLRFSRQENERSVRHVQSGKVEQVVFLSERPIDVARATHWYR